MKKTTITFTALPQRALSAERKLRLSVFIAPRLWTDDLAEEKQILPLSQYPLLVDWPSQVGDLQFSVKFGSKTLLATPISLKELRSDLWGALFPPSIPVKPYRFENMTNVSIQTIDTAFLHDWLRDLYRRVGTERAYGLGEENPAIKTMQRDPGLAQIANASQPEPPYVPPAKRRVPVKYKSEEPKPEEGGCLRGCLSQIFDALNWIASKLGLGKPFKLPGQSFMPIQVKEAKVEVAQPAAANVTLPTQAQPKPIVAAAPQVVNPNKAKFDDVVSFVQPFDPVEVIPAQLTEEQLKNLLDFHEAVALAADYPTLLRALGLVVDLEVDWPANLPTSGMVSVKVEPQPGGNVYFYPMRTHYTLSDTHFLAAPRPVEPESQTETRDGLLRLSDENRYKVIQTDVVGAAIKVQNTATSIAALLIPGLQPANPPTEATLPSLRSAGFAVVQSDLAAQLSATYVQAVGLNNALAVVDGSPPATLLPGAQPPITIQPVVTDELWAEDVIRGYRMDVRDLDSASQKWRSLHQRAGVCRFTRPQPEIPFPVTDEGYIQVGVTEPVEGSAKKIQRVPDVLATWTGWSLSTVRPGEALEEKDTPPNDTKTAFKMIAEFAPVSGSLPRLRFGHRYQLRMRTVDLAGNSAFGPEPDDAEFQQTHADDTPAQVYRRFEPVPSPAVVLRQKPIEGESVERLVVRSAFELTTDPQNVNRLTTERHIAPPKSAQLLAEYHGKFDDAGKLNPDQDTYNLATYEANTLSHHWTFVANKWALIPLLGTEFLPDADDKKDPTFWQTKEAFPVKYLPDVLARQAVLRNLPGPTKNVVTHIPFNGNWPGYLPFRLELVGIPAGKTPKVPEWKAEPGEPETRILQVELPQGESCTVRLNSGTDQDDLPQLGVWDWETDPQPQSYSTIHDYTTQGLNWLLMPYRTLELVHATQKPLKMPVMSITNVKKALGDTAAHLTGTTGVHAKTTGKVDVLALWTDPVDDLSKDLPGETKSRAAVCEVHVTSPDDNTVDVVATHNLGDTKYHRVTYVARGATRFREYMPEALLKSTTPGNKDMDLITTPTEAEIAAGNLTTAAVVDIPNSTRPLAPVVDYIVPSFGRVEEVEKVEPKWTTITRVRKGSGLRVYLQRPWYSSGQGELLGVVFIAAKNFANVPESLRPYVTEWANDPLWPESTADLTPSLENFENPTASSSSPDVGTITLEETGDTVQVAGYPVEFDPVKKLWFADVEFKGLNAYTPMVRLAVARFQPISVDGAYISRVARADFIQPLPDRKLVITKPYNSLSSLHVMLTPLNLNTGGLRQVNAWVEEQTVPEQGELGWRRIETGVSLQTNTTEVWEAALSFAAPQTRYRLVVQETEPIDATGGEGEVVVMANPLTRTVYADTREFTIPA